MNNFGIGFKHRYKTCKRIDDHENVSVPSWTLSKTLGTPANKVGFSSPRSSTKALRSFNSRSMRSQLLNHREFKSKRIDNIPRDNSRPKHHYGKSTPRSTGPGYEPEEEKISTHRPRSSTHKFHLW